MSRRPVGIQILIGVGVVGLFLFGLYQYNDVQTRLKRSDEKNEKLKQDQDSLSTQLRVLYEHKSNLEKSLDHEKSEHSKTKQTLQDEKKELESRLTREKLTLEEKISSLTSENKRLQSRYDDLQAELGKTKDKLTQLEEDKAKALEKFQQEYMQLKQERENEVAQLNDKVADLKRRNDKLQTQNGDTGKNDDDTHDTRKKGSNTLRNKPRVGPDTGNNNANENEENGGILQIKKPDDGKPKGYFNVKPAKNEGDEDAQVRNIAPSDNEREGNGNHAADDRHEGKGEHDDPMQVAPPNPLGKHDKQDSLGRGTGGVGAENGLNPGGAVAFNNRGNHGDRLGHDTGNGGQLNLPAPQHGDHGIYNGHGNPGGFEKPNDIGARNGLGQNAGVGGQEGGVVDREAIGGRLGDNVVDGQVRGGVNSDLGQNAQIALPQAQDHPRPLKAGALDSRRDNENDERNNDNNNDDNGGENDGRVAGGRGADNRELYDDDKEMHNRDQDQDRRGPNAGPVDDTVL